MDAYQQSELLEQEMLDKSSRLKTLRYAVLDMMDDFIPEDVMQVNLYLAKAKLDEITEARILFSSAVQKYLRMFASCHSGVCFKLQNQLEELNQ